MPDLPLTVTALRSDAIELPSLRIVVVPPRGRAVETTLARAVHHDAHLAERAAVGRARREPEGGELLLHLGEPPIAVLSASTSAA